ncbi:hypothetical protein ANN_03885 [Periplaneta americana]|uniref:Uncharacterized protein n=1 Tax=Periplaneta americana TaxID=6978 RepID=A0ABQ8U048_PERAM|nr:hypothetical protein ANN_03885 [Periplaneta americana]
MSELIDARLTNENGVTLIVTNYYRKRSHSDTMRKLVNKFRDTGSILDKKQMSILEKNILPTACTKIRNFDELGMAIYQTLRIETMQMTVAHELQPSGHDIRLNFSPNIFLNTLFSNNLNLRSSLKVRVYKFHNHKEQPRDFRPWDFATFPRLHECPMRVIHKFNISDALHVDICTVNRTNVIFIKMEGKGKVIYSMRLFSRNQLLESTKLRYADTYSIYKS